jgi:hypothetical protein
MGQMYEQLVGRGLVGDGSDLRRRVELSEEFGVLGPGMSGERARTIQAERVKRTLGDYAKALAAINDIFADAGRPNTPTGQLFAEMDRLTAGGFGTMDPGSMARALRVSQAVAQMTGMGIETQGGLTAQIAGGLQAGGQSRALAPYLTQYTALLGRTYTGPGLVFGGPEGQTIEEVLARRTRLAVAGATSDSARVDAAVFALAESAPAGAPVAQLAAALKSGARTFTLPDGRVVDPLRLLPEDVNAAAAASGLGAGALQRQIMAPSQVQGAAARNAEALMAANRVRQEEDARLFVSESLTRAVPTFTPDRSRAVFDAVQEQIARGGFRSDDELVNLVGGRMGLSDAERFQVKTQIGAWGGWRALADVNPTLRGEADRRMRLATGQATAAERLEAVQRGGWRRQLAQVLVDYGGGANRSPVGWLLRGMGLVSNAEFEDALLSAGAGGGPSVADYLSGITGFKVSAGDLALGRDLSPAALTAALGARGAVGGELPVANPWRAGAGGAPEPAALEEAPMPRAKGAAGAVGARSRAQVDITMSGVTVVINRDGRGTITGGGAIREG